MAGKRLLDAAQFLSAAKSISGKHIAARRQQLDVYTRTSSLTEGLRDKGNSIIVTAQAASAIFQRFNEAPHSPPSDRQNSAYSQTVETARESAAQYGQDAGQSFTGGTKEKNTSVEVEKTRDLSAHQIPREQAVHDVDVKPDDLTINQTQETSFRPSQISKSSQSNNSELKLPASTNTTQPSEPEGPPDEILQSVFHSPRVANLLLSKERRPHPAGVKSHLPEHRPVEYSQSPGPSSKSEAELELNKEETKNIAIEDSILRSEKKESTSETIESLSRELEVS